MPNKRINELIGIISAIIAIILTIVIIYGVSVYGDKNRESVDKTKYLDTAYVEKIFEDSYVHEIDIQIPDINWEYMIEHALEEAYVICDVVIDGELIENVSIRPKGNSSLNSIANAGDDHFSFKLEFDHYHKNNTYYGLDKLVLNNLSQDVSCMKEYIVYHMMNETGIPAPLTSYVHIKKNGEDFGLYLAIEGVEDSFAYRNYGREFGNIYKPECLGMANITPKIFMSGDYISNFQNVDKLGPGDRFELTTAIRAPFEMMYGDAMKVTALQYLGEDKEAYSIVYDSTVFDIDENDKQSYINAVRTLNGTDNPQSAIDVEKVLKYFIVHNFVFNYDSYTSTFDHNYYVREHNGQLSMIPWDYNLAFGSFTMETIDKLIGQDSDYHIDLSELKCMSEEKSIINYPIDTPCITIEMEERPLINVLLTDEKCLEQYHELFADFLKNFFASGEFERLYYEAWNNIEPYIENGQTFYSIEEARKASRCVYDFCILRNESVSGQLEGSIPATFEGQRKEYEKLVETGDFHIADSTTYDGFLFGIHSKDFAQIFDQIAGDNPHNNEGLSAGIEDIQNNPKENITKVIWNILTNSELIKNALKNAVIGPLLFLLSIIALIIEIRRVKKYERH